MAELESEPEDELIRNRYAFVETVRTAREAKGFTQQRLEELCGGNSASYICYIERTGCALQLLICRRLAAVLDLDAKCLLRSCTADQKAPKTPKESSLISPAQTPRTRRG
jgi:transcriptional regulator with XRE-family HTH domain